MKISELLARFPLEEHLEGAVEYNYIVLGKGSTDRRFVTEESAKNYAHILIELGHPRVIINKEKHKPTDWSNVEILESGAGLAH